MAFFTGYFQKKALGFALSQLGLFDQGAFDLDSQGITWGSTTVLELHDVPLSTSRLTELLQLPTHVTLAESRILSLRLTLPLNFVSNSVAVEIDGVRVKLLVAPDDQTSNTRKVDEPGLARGVKANLPRTTAGYPEDTLEIPTTEDLAESFLATESEHEKAKFRSILVDAQSPRPCLSPDDAGETGLGPDVSLKAFFSNMAKGVFDRFKATIQDIQIEAVFKLPSPTSSQSGCSEDVTFCFDIHSIDIPPVLDRPKEVLSTQKDGASHVRAREISIIGVHGSLLLTSALSSFMTQLSRPPSPTLSRASSKIPDTSPSSRYLPPSSLSSTHSRSGTLDYQDFSPSTRYYDFRSSSTPVGKTALQPSDDQSVTSVRPGLEHSLLDDVGESVPSDFGQDSQALTASDMLNIQSGPATLQMSASDMDSSVLSENSESFLSKSPQSQGRHFEDPRSHRSYKHLRDGVELLDGSSQASIGTDLAKDNEDDLTQSKYFSDEEARSLYMSAMDLNPEEEESLQEQTRVAARQQEADGAQYRLKGKDSSISGRSAVIASTTIGSSLHKRDGKKRKNDSSDDDSPPASLLASTREERFTTSPQDVEQIKSSPSYQAPTNTLVAESENASIQIPPIPQSSVKTILAIGEITIQLPPASDAVTVESIASETKSTGNIPGAFSMHESFASAASDQADSAQKEGMIANQSKNISEISIRVSRSVISFDMALVRLVVMIGTILPPVQPTTAQRVPTSNQTSQELSCNTVLPKFIVRFEDSLHIHPRHDQAALTVFIHEVFHKTSRDLLRLTLLDTKVTVNWHGKTSTTELLIGKASLGFPDEHILSFNQDLKMRESVKDISAVSGHDFSLKMVQIQNSTNSVPQLDVNSAPLHVNVNIKRLAEVLDWLGGLSTVLDLGNSMRSTMTVTRTPSPPVKSGSRVRFETDTIPAGNTVVKKKGPKFNIRIGGLVVDILGSRASIRVQSSALKFVLRDEAIRARIDKIKISGPILDDVITDPGLMVSMDVLELSFLEFPKESDIERLLALLSPSQNYDEQDDDIMLGTLIRQREKGAILRLNIQQVKAQVSELQTFGHFATLGEELSQLSSVTKYLPEDDKPGLLMLAVVEQVDLNLNINDNIKGLKILLTQTDIALVTFPSLLLTNIGTIHAVHNDIELVGQATPNVRNNSIRQNVPVRDVPNISLKYIAGEMEPTLKTKLYDIKFEYHVTTLMTMLGLSQTASGDVVVAEMVNTVANLAALQTTESIMTEKDPTSKNQKPLRLNIGIRDTIIGLNPKDKPAQGLLVLTDCRLTAMRSHDKTTPSGGSLEISKASFMVVDSKENLLVAENVIDPHVILRLGTKPTQIQCLQAIGYVSVGQTSSAKFMAQLKEFAETSQLDITIRNDLLVLETCADSMQTLITVFNGLAPPMPPSKGIKYRTEVVPIQDMLASFSGEGFAIGNTRTDDTTSTVSEDEETGVIAVDEELDLELGDDLLGSEIEPGYESVISGLGSILYKQSGKSSILPQTVTTSFQEKVQAQSSIHVGNKHYESKTSTMVREWDSFRHTYKIADPEKIRNSPMRIHLEDVHFIWHLFDGYDWKKTRDTISQAVNEVEAKAEERRAARREKLRPNVDDENDAIIGDMLFNSIYIGVAAKQDPQDLRAKINGLINDGSSETGSYATATTVNTITGRPGTPKTRKKKLYLGRSKEHKMTFELSGVSGQVVSFPPGSGETQSCINIKVHNLEIFDHVPTSTWRKFATCMQEPETRQHEAGMVRVELMVVKPDPELTASDFVLKVDVLPVRLHVDQDALDFLTRFFEFRDETEAKPAPSGDIPFIQRAEIGPIKVKLDFKPKHVDWRALRSGRTSEFMNFIILEEADMILRQLILHGVKGFDKLGGMLNDIWTPDVKNNQLPGVLAGLAPVRPFVNVGMGVADLVIVPMREYKKDGRLVRAVRKGVMSFGKTTTTELAKLGTKLAIGTHTMLSNAETLLVPEGSRTVPRPDGDEQDELTQLSPYANQPIGVVQGLRGAYRGLERDLLMAKDAIIAMPGEIMDNETASGAAAAFLRTAPVVILRPAMGVTKAVGQTLMGATNSLDKTTKRRLEDKYKHR